MPDAYSELIDEFSRKLEAIEEKSKDVEKVPNSVEEKLRDAKFHRVEADKKYSQGHIDEALKEMKEATDCADQAMFKLHLTVPFQKICVASEFFKKRENLASQHIPNYFVHNSNFLAVKRLLESDERIDEIETSLLSGSLYKFLADIGNSKGVLVAVIKEKRRAKWVSRVTGVAAILAAIASIIELCLR